MIGKPVKARIGEGFRNIDCERYDECLDYAARNDWRGFDCGTCSHHAKERGHTMSETGQTQAQLCVECGEKERMGNSPYCSSCMAVRANRARAENRRSERPRKRTDNPTRSKPGKALEEPSTALRIDFGIHAAILREIEKLADKEIRPLECQVIYMLKTQLDKMGEERA